MVGYAWSGLRIRTNSSEAILKNETAIGLDKVDLEGAEWLVLKGATRIMPQMKRWCVEPHGTTGKGELGSLFDGFEHACGWLDGNHIYAWRQEAS